MCGPRIRIRPKVNQIQTKYLFCILGIRWQDGGLARRGVGHSGLRGVLSEDGREPLQLHIQLCSVIVGFDYASASERELCAVFSHATVVLEL